MNGPHFSADFGAHAPRFPVCAHFDLEGAGVDESAGTFPTFAAACDHALRIAEGGYITNLLDRYDPRQPMRASATVTDGRGACLFSTTTYLAATEALSQ